MHEWRISAHGVCAMFYSERVDLLTGHYRCTKSLGLTREHLRYRVTDYLCYRAVVIARFQIDETVNLITGAAVFTLRLVHVGIVKGFVNGSLSRYCEVGIIGGL